MIAVLEHTIVQYGKSKDISLSRVFGTGPRVHVQSIALFDTFEISGKVRREEKTTGEAGSRH
ncbi:MAG: hypothetical protein ACMUIA_08640 [bacterium]